MDPKCLIPGDATLIENIVNYLKAKGIFDEFRHECLADVDTKSSCQNLSQRVDGYTSKFLANETWHPDLNKNELRNKLRRHIDEAGFLAPGADIVVEQAINPKVYHYFLPKVIEVVHQYVKEQTELLNKKPETISANKNFLPVSEKPINDAVENKDKTPVSDPIADILSFSFHAKSETVQHKHGDIPKVEKKKEEKCILTTEKHISEIHAETLSASVNETKIYLEREKDKIKREDPEIQPEVLKKTVKDEVKSEKKKADDVKVSVTEITTASEESKSNMPTISKSNVSSKKDDKTKHKFKSQNMQKVSSSSNEMKKSKKELSEKSSDKLNKAKSVKSSKESLSPTKISSSHKNIFKEEKGENSRTKSHDANSSKTSESSIKKSKSSYDKKDSSNSKHKGHSEKSDKLKISKSVDKNDHHDLSNNEKNSKSIQYSSSYDSSQGSDQEKNTSSNTKKEKSKHFSKHASKEKLEQSDNSSKVDKKRSNNGDENPLKKYKNEKDVKLKLKDVSAVEAAKISSRSNSFGSTSSVSSSSNASKDNLASNSDEALENPVKEKKKKHAKEKDSCQNSSKTLPPPPPPPPPPPSCSFTSEPVSSTEMSSVEDTQSSLSESDVSSSEVISEESCSDLELECKDLINDTLNESALNSSTDNINEFYDIFLYSSSSSEFEGYGNSPGKKNALENEFNNMHESDISISSVHTSDLSSFDDELSSDDEVSFLTGGLKKRLTLKEAQELIENKANLIEKNKIKSKTYDAENSFSEKNSQKSSSLLSSDEESPPSEPVRLLRRERKLNPRYSSSEYTSIFNCKKETFITKQSSPSVKSQTSSPKIETNVKKTDSSTEKVANKSMVQSKSIKMHSDELEISDKSKSNLKKKLQGEDDQLNDNKISGSDEIVAIMDKDKLFKENNKNNLIADDDKLKDHKKIKMHNNSKMRRNSHSLKRKLEIAESTPIKRPCSRSSVDSSSSEFAPNENKPFNSEKKDFNEEKKLNDCGLKVSDLNIEVKKELFNKQRTNNNGDILGQKDIFSKTSHSKVINSEKKTSESDTSNELNSL